MNPTLLSNRLKNFILFFIILFSAGIVNAQDTEVPLNLTGFNGDVIADAVINTPVNTVTNDSIDPSSPGHVFFAQGYSTNATPYPFGLPTNGQITTAFGSGGHNFQLANYTGNNVLHLAPLADTTALIFDPVNQAYYYDSLAILGLGAGGLTQVNYVICFHDNTTFVDSLIFPDWGATYPPSSPYGITGLDRVSLADGSSDGSPIFTMYDDTLTLWGGNQNKVIDSIRFFVPGNQVGDINLFAITGYGKPTSALPLTLSFFGVSPDNGEALVQWKTAQEFNVSKFIIQRASQNSPSSFLQVGSVNSSGSQNGFSYNFLDAPGAAGTFYYRLVQVGIDGSTKILGIKSITFNSNNSWTVQDLGSQWRIVCAQPFIYRLLDLQGRVISGNNANGNTYVAKPAASGIYQLQVETGGVISSRKLVK